jgi:AraC-like DNA-binding protein
MFMSSNDASVAHKQSVADEETRMLHAAANFDNAPCSWVPEPMASSLQRVPSCDDLLRDPFGKFTVGSNFLIWCTKPELCGIVLWGRVSLAEMALLTRVYDQGETCGIALPCDFVFDARRLEGLEVGAFEILVRDVAARVSNLQRRLRRQAFVRSSSIWGAALSGFYPVLDVQFESQLFTELAPALAWLDEPDHQLAEQLEALIPVAISGSPLVDRLRGWLATQIGQRPSIQDAAHALAISGRSLQRHLHDAGTSFRAELDRARLLLAQQLLLETELKIAAIAEHVGSSSEANFISFFRRMTTHSPAEWRREHSR